MFDPMRGVSESIMIAGQLPPMGTGMVDIVRPKDAMWLDNDHGQRWCVNYNNGGGRPLL